MSPARFELRDVKTPVAVLRSMKTRSVLEDTARQVASAAMPGTGVVRGRSRSGRIRAAAVTVSIEARLRERREHTLANALGRVRR